MNSMASDIHNKSKAARRRRPLARRRTGRPVGYRPGPGTPVLIFAEKMPIGRSPGGRAVVFTTQE